MHGLAPSLLFNFIACCGLVPREEQHAYAIGWLLVHVIFGFLAFGTKFGMI